MKLQYLGTAAAEGWPAIFCTCESCERARALGGKNIRSRSQAIVDDALLLDLPADTYMHALNNGLRLGNVEHLLITHAHSDHWYAQELGMHRPPFFGKSGKYLHVYGSKSVAESFHRQFGEENPLSEYCGFSVLEPFESVAVGKYTVTPVTALHDRKQICFNYLISDGSKTLLYAHDTGIYTEDVWAFLKGKRLDAVSLDCNYQGGSDGGNHMGLPDNVIVRDRMLSEGIADDKTIFAVNHFSHNSGWDHETMEREAGKLGFLTSYDGMTVEI